MLLTNDQSIIALCTPRGSGALALLRISGNGVYETIEKMVSLSSGKSLLTCLTHTIHHGHVIDPDKGDVIDEVLFSVMRGPRTFTGEDTIEVSCHNNQFIIDKIIASARACGVRLAQPGEFSRRAVLNGKMDVVQAEAINDVIHAQSEQALKASLGQLRGSLSYFAGQLEHELTKLLGIVEASFEFLDEEQRDVNFDEIITSRLALLEKDLKKTIDSFAVQQQIKDGVRIALIGSVNAGKSTLFNALLDKDRAIVTNIEGTTRDSIEAGLYRNGIFWTLIDTAGLRSTGDVIEKQGISRSLDEAEKADILVVVVDASQQLDATMLSSYQDILKKHSGKSIIVANKIDSISDYSCPLSTDVIEVSAKNKRGLDRVIGTIENKVQNIFSKCTSPFLLNKRQHSLLCDVASKLDVVQKQCAETLAHELMAHHLRECLELLAQLTGKNVTEKVFDSVFNDFCVGK